MKNGDLPAMPVDTAQLYESRCNNGTWELGSLGLTKREMFAMAAMQGLLVNAMRSELTFDTAPAQAVKCADALLAELEKAK